MRENESRRRAEREDWKAYAQGELMPSSSLGKMKVSFQEDSP